MQDMHAFSRARAVVGGRNGWGFEGRGREGDKAAGEGPAEVIGRESCPFLMGWNISKVRLQFVVAVLRCCITI